MKIAYQNANVTLYEGDCREVMAELPDESVDLLWTDPPYGHGNHDKDWNSRLNDHRGIEQKPIANDDADGMRSVVDGMLLQAVRVLRRDSCCCCCCGGGGPKPTFAWVAQRMDSGGLDFFHSVIWDKINPGLGWRYRRQHEMVMVAHRHGGKLRWADDKRAVPNIWRGSKPRGGAHPNEKPLGLVGHFIGLHTVEGDTVLDPFAGSGTTLIQALEMGRKAIGIELEPKWADLAAERLAKWHEQGQLTLCNANPGADRMANEKGEKE